MKGQITVLPEDEWEEWYENTEGDDSASGNESASIGGPTVGGVPA